jgi:hypothetical protein
MYPSEAPIDNATVTAIEVLHPPAEVDVLGWRTHWLVPFLGLSILSGFALKGVFRVEL